MPEPHKDERANRSYDTPEAFSAAFRLFNAFFAVSDGIGWAETDARKPHVDHFGLPIQPGDTYYKMSPSSHWSGDLKVSIDSMDKVMALFLSNPLLAETAKGLAADHEERLRDAYRRWGQDMDALARRNFPGGPVNP